MENRSERRLIAALRRVDFVGKDNTLFVKVAVWLNDTGQPIHMEPTWITVFQVEDASGNPIELDPRTMRGVSARRKTAALDSYRKQRLPRQQ